eukprot:scaffold1225_cov109-Isochrysis_galbana.AAC.3
MPRLPSALGLGGAKRTGGRDWTLNPPMRSDSPNSPNPPSPPPLKPLHTWQLPTRREGPPYSAASPINLFSPRSPTSERFTRPHSSALRCPSPR